MLTYPKSLPRNESDHLVGLFNAGRYSELESRARDLVKEYPDTGLAWKILGASLLAQGKDALSALKRAAEFMPDDAEAHNNLGVALIDRGDANNAILRFRRALDIDPYYAEAHNSLGAILKVLGRLDESISSLRRALEISPEYAQAHRNLGAALQEVGRLDDAVTSYRRALEIDPDDADTHNNLGTVLKDLGRLKDAVASYHRALQIKPDYAEVHSNLLFIQNYLPEQSAEVLLADARHFGDLAARKACLDTDWPNSPEPDRCLRVGFVSGDLRGHPVGHFLQNVLPAVSSNASGRLQLFGYPTHYLSDALTEGIKACCHGWHPAVGFSDETLARRIRDDGIDILIDLAGHTAHNRLSVFAWKPAPVQVSWLGYFATTGVAAIDYLIADHWTLPESEEAHFTEKIWRLPETRLCYSSPEAIVDVAPLPALINACITFGCFNDLTKVNDAVVALWARLLVAVPNSRLFLKAKQFNDNLERTRITQRFAVRGVGADRLVLAGSSPRIEYLEAYNQVDISLDPFPYPGGATTVDSLWMGVPVLTLAGERFLSRQGVGLLMNAGLPDWIAVDADDYVARAVSHAGDLQRLALLRKNLRQQVLNSPLFDAPRFAGHFETALRGMWKNWCARRSLATPATSMPQDEGDQLVALFDAERHAELDSRARALLERCPDSGPVWKVLGASLQVQGKDALSTLKRAAELMPDDAEVQNNLGIALQHRGQFEAALARFRRALEIEPDYAGAHRNLGVILKTLGQLDDAVTSFRRVLELKPDDAEAYSNLGAALRDSGQLDDAMESYHQALRINPDYAEAHRNLGNVLLDKGQPDAAIASYRRALEIAPDFAKAHSNLGGALHALGQLDDAVASYRRALDLDPDFAEAYSNLGAALYALGQLDDAVASYRRALEIAPDYVNAHSNLGIVLTDLGQLDDAVASYRRTLRIKPDHSAVHSALLCIHNYLPDQSVGPLLGEARRFGDLVAQQACPYPDWSNIAEPGRCLRIGFVSGDLRVHPVGYFAEGILAALASRAAGRLELVVYQSSVHADALTQRLRHCCNAWHSVFGLSDENLARRIRDDGIDILIDLSGHTAHNRLPMFAWKPAPVQVSWLGYFATTGVEAIDYLIADPWTLPESEEANFTEKIWRLPETRLCFTPPDADVEVAPLPALANGHITFGCFNNLTKVNDAVVALWAKVLKAVPGSRLFLKTKQLGEATVRESVLGRFAVHGIDVDRLILEGFSPRSDYLAAYQRVDIALDPFPFPGGTTTVESLWMGVPVLSLAGASFLSRQGVGLLTNAGLTDLIAADLDNYVARAASLAGDLQRLASLRQGLRQQVLDSPLFDAPRFVRHFEAALRGMWREWCTKQPVSSSSETSSPADTNELFSMFNAGRYAELEVRTHRLIQQYPDCGIAWKLLGASLQVQGKEALSALQRAAELLPDDVEAHSNLGAALRDNGQIDAAIRSYCQALKINPDYAEAHRNLGNVLLDKGQPDAAVASYRRALEIAPDFAKAHSNLGGALHALGQLDDAVASYRRALELNPDFAEAHSNLGAALYALGQLNDAVACYRRALEIDADYVNAHNNLGIALTDLGQLDDAVASYRRALEGRPDFAKAHSNLAAALRDLGHVDNAVASCQRALAINPDLAEAHHNFGVILKDIGQVADAISSFRQALKIKPDFSAAHSSLLFVHNYSSDQCAEQLLAEARRFGEVVAGQARPYSDWPNTPEPGRCLRVGMVSGDLHNHPVGHFVEGVLAALVANVSCQLELVAYLNMTRTDALTERIKACCHGWRLVMGLSDEILARRIRDDRIDILIDLSGHTAHNRLPVFAWKPAPVQISWLGYFATTGVAAIDYLIADPWTLPKSEEAHFTEKIWRLPETRLCYTPPDEGVEVAPLPAFFNSYITFGCFNNLTKVNEGVVALWARVLVAVPDSRLFLKAKQLNDGSARECLVQRFAAQGIGADRLVLEGSSPRMEYLAAYGRVDIALDPLPYPGGATTIESLWMGVPVLSLAGERFLSRQGVGLLINAGLPDWIASDLDDYVCRAVAHTADLEALAILRRGLRKQVLASPLFDAPRFAHHFDAALRDMWQAWCKEQPMASQNESIPEHECDQLITLFNAGEYGDVERQARVMVGRYPESGFAWGVLGASLQVQGKDGLPMLQKAAEFQPDDAEAQNNLGVALLHAGQPDASLAACRRAVNIEPEYAEGHYNLASAEQRLGKLDEAVVSYRRALAIEPEFVKAFTNLGAAFQDLGRIDEAVASFQRAIELDPSDTDAYLKLAVAQTENWQVGHAVVTCREGQRINPEDTRVFSGLICTEGYLPEVSASRQMAEACRFGDLVLRRAKAYANHGNPTEANRCLRVGFVSADFRAHPVGYFMEGFLAALKEHVSGRIAPFAYSVSSHTDDTTDRIKASCDVWRSVADLSDETLARQIREDGIDILIDLGGHTGANRLSMFAWKPAPVQASWLGYLGTTGVAAIDYLVADSWVLPEADEAHYTEQVVRLPSTYLCFTPPDVDIEVNPLRAVSNGYVTFGCFNNLAKVNDGVIELWSRVLASVPQSRLFLKARQFRDKSIRKRIIDCFAGHGIESWRLVLEGKVPSRAEHLADYHRVDISLDPFPYSGITTSLESLWMGVPVLTLAGEGFLSRQGVGLLMNAGMPEWIATNPDDYVARAVRHARDLKSLASLRSGLRQQVLASPLFDAPRFALHFEAALLDMWQAWCARKAFPAKERTPMKTFLHVGCGPQHKERTTRGFNTPEWAELRLDIDEAANPDVVGSMLDMSVVVDGSMDAVFSSHNIEHLYPQEVPVALAEFLRVLKPDGFVVITCPDLQSVCQLIAEDKLTDPAYISPAGPISPLDILYGHRASLQGGNLHMAHRCGFTERVLIATLQDAGFVGIVSGSRAYPNYDLWAVATKGPMSEEEIAGLAAAHFPE